MPIKTNERKSLSDRRLSMPILDKKINLHERKLSIPDKKITIPDKKINFHERKISNLEKKDTVIINKNKCSKCNNKFSVDRVKVFIYINK